MKTIKTEGIILKNLDYKETSKIIKIITPLGLLSLRALGVKNYKNKNFNSYEFLTLVNVEISDQEFPTLIDFNLEEKFPLIKKDFSSFMWTSMMLGVSYNFDSNINYDKTFSFLKRMLLEIEKGADAKLLALLYLTKILILFGIKPEFNSCIICGNPNSNFFSIKKGGAVCSNHKDTDYLLSDVKRLYYFDLKHSFSELMDINLDNVYLILQEYYNFYLDINLNKYKIL